MFQLLKTACSMIIWIFFINKNTKDYLNTFYNAFIHCNLEKYLLCL